MPVTKHLRRRPNKVANQRKRLRQRDGDECCWCGRTMLFADSGVEGWVNHPDQASLEHVVPLSEGGNYSDENCKLAHKACNYARTPMAARLRAKGLLPNPAPIPAPFDSPAPRSRGLRYTPPR